MPTNFVSGVRRDSLDVMCTNSARRDGDHIRVTRYLTFNDIKAGKFKANQNA